MAVVGVGKQLSDTEKKLLDSGHSFVEIDARYASFKIVRKEDELTDENFPVDMAAGMQLFIMAGLKDNASNCKACIDAQIKVLEKGPDGKSQHRLGSGAVCWGCGYTGLPTNNEAFDAGRPKRQGTVAVCARCGSDEQTNLVNAVQEDGKTRLPWIEPHNENSEDQVMAAKKAEEMEKLSKKAPVTVQDEEEKERKREEIRKRIAAQKAAEQQVTQDTQTATA